MIFAVFSIILVCSGFFSRTVNVELAVTFPPRVCNFCEKVQLTVNIVITTGMFSLAMIASLLEMNCFVGEISLFVLQFLLNCIYTFIALFVSWESQRRKTMETLKNFLEEDSYQHLSNDDILKKFCRSYPDVKRKQALKALNRLSKKRVKAKGNK